VARSSAPLRAAHAPAPVGPPAPLRASDDGRRSGRLSGALILVALLALIGFGVAVWSIVPTLYVRPDGPRAAEPPRAAELRQDLRRVALRLAEPVTIRRP
jgi:hypothetical protein